MIYFLLGTVLTNGANNEKDILDYVFNGCSNLTSISVDSKNSHYSSGSNGILYNKGKTELVQYPNGRKNTSFTIPNNVTSIHRVAFADSNYLESVIIPDSVKTIGDAAFEYCDSLVSIRIPKGVTEINDSTFSYCVSLKSVELSEGVKSIGWYAFAHCSNLKSILIPKSVTSIHNLAFEDTDNFYIRCYKNSYAHRYAIDNEIPFRFIGTSVISVDINDIGNIDSCIWHLQWKKWKAVISMASKGCAFLMDMGTGKTITTIAVAGTMFRKHKIVNMLVVCPKSIVDVWEQEFEKFADFNYSLAVLDGSCSKKADTIRYMIGTGLQVIVVNYESCWRLESEL